MEVSRLRNFLQIIYLSSTLAFLASCATTAINPDQQQNRQEFRKNSTHISFQARTIVRQQGAVYHFNLHWQQQNNQFQAEGFDFLGRHVFQIMGDQEQAIFRQNGEQTRASSRDIIRQQLGIDIDPASLSHVLQGVVLEGAQVDMKDGLVSRQQRAQLTIVYASYTESNGYQLPSKVTVQTGDVSLKMILHSWQIQ